MLFHMCKISRKLIFVAGFGMQFLATFCAIGTQKLQVINGNGKGGPLSEIRKIDKSVLEELTINHVFLDSLDGDFFKFDHKTKKWMPSGNVGLHYKRSIERSQGKTGGLPQDPPNRQVNAGLTNKTNYESKQKLSD